MSPGSSMTLNWCHCQTTASSLGFSHSSSPGHVPVCEWLCESKDVGNQDSAHRAPSHQPQQGRGQVTPTPGVRNSRIEYKSAK